MSEHYLQFTLLHVYTTLIFHTMFMFTCYYYTDNISRSDEVKKDDGDRMYIVNK